MISLTRSELQQRRLSTMLWAIAILALTGMIVGFYPSVRNDPSLNSLYADLSPAAQGLLGGSDLVSGVGYLNTQMFSFFIPAVLLVLGLGRGAAVVAGEEEERTLDLLLAQPVSRATAYAQKSLAVGLALALLTVCVFVPLALFDNTVQFDVGIRALGAVCLQMFLMCLALAMFCQAIAAASGRRAIGLAAVVGYTVVSYLIYGLSTSVAWMEHLRPLTVWRWYLGNDPLTTGFGWWEIAVLAAASLVGVVLGVIWFNRRDLRA
jgi:beta-exotoxin I transport system permease protein